MKLLHELVEYIALNDCPGDAMNEEDLFGLPSVKTAAIALNRTAGEIAVRVLKFREKETHYMSDRKFKTQFD